MTDQKLELELATDLHLSENMGQDSLSQKTKKDKERFEQVVTIQNKIQTIKANLNQLIQALNHNPSLLSRAASFWNEIPWGQKITAGVVLTVPLLIIGIMANLAALITLSIVIVIVYTASHILLENHQSQNKDNIKNLQIGVSSLVDLFDTVISTLDILREQLAIEIDAFQKENAQLVANIDQFCKQIKTLKSEVIGLTDIEKALRTTQVNLEHTATRLKSSIVEQSNTQKELDRVVQANKENQKLLSDKIKELDEVKVKMSREVEQARAVGRVLRGTVETFSNIVIKDKEQQAAFQKRLEDFLANNEKSFIEIADRMCDAERKLSLVTKQLEENNQRYRSLLDRHEQQIISFEQMNVRQTSKVQESCDGVKPSINGFHAIKKAPPFSNHKVAMTAVI